VVGLSEHAYANMYDKVEATTTVRHFVNTHMPSDALCKGYAASLTSIVVGSADGGGGAGAAATWDGINYPRADPKPRPHAAGAAAAAIAPDTA
jgi:hypothetical protein